jgi:hypothetical protein
MTGSNNRVALILDAGDLWGDQAHAYRVIEQTEMFAEAGMEVTDVDLRDYIPASPHSVPGKLPVFSGRCVRGGSCQRPACLRSDLVEDPQQIANQQDQQYCPKSYARASAGAPTAVAVVPTA